jgi:microcystin-dependent protein
MSFRVTNTSQNVIANKLNFDIIPRLQSHIALQVGDYKISARSSDINGWMVCNGRSLLRSDYPALFSVIGTDFGSVDGTHFNLPDYTSKVIGMYGPTMGSMTGYTERERGDIVGHETIQLTVPQLPAHSHTGTTDSAGAHTHQVSDMPYGIQNIAAASGGGTTACDETTHTVTTSSNGAHTHTFTTQNTGENDDIDVMQPTLFGSSVLIFAKFMKNYQLVPTTWA